MIEIAPVLYLNVQNSNLELSAVSLIASKLIPFQKDSVFCETNEIGLLTFPIAEIFPF